MKFWAVKKKLDLHSPGQILKELRAESASRGARGCFRKFGGFGPSPMATTAEARDGRCDGFSSDSGLKEEHHWCS